jgi:hypothetical protein
MIAGLTAPGRHRPAVVAAAALVAGMLAACSPPVSREDRIERQRAQYSASMRSVTVKQWPMGIRDGESDPVATGSATAPVEGHADLAASERSVPAVRTEVVLDLRIAVRGKTELARLPGLTLDVVQIDSDHRPKKRSAVWVDTDGVTPEQAADLKHVLRDVEWATGDTFTVEVRTPVPPSERSEYREFAAPG